MLKSHRHLVAWHENYSGLKVSEAPSKQGTFKSINIHRFRQIPDSVNKASVVFGGHTGHNAHQRGGGKPVTCGETLD